MRGSRTFSEKSVDERREYRRLLRTTPVPVAIHREGRVVFANDAALDLLGFEAEEEALGRQLLDFVHPEDRAEVVRRLRALEVDRQSVELRELRVRDRDGRVLHVEAAGMPVTFEGLPAILTTARDVTEARAIRRALRRSEARFRAVAESATDAILTIDEESRIRYANPSTRRLFGYGPDELVGGSLLRLIPERYRERHLGSLSQYLRTGERHLDWEGVQMPALRRSGEEFEAEVSFGDYEIDGDRFFTGILRDVTERKRVRRAVEESEARYRRLFEDSLDAIYVTRRDGSIIDMNPAGLEMLGYTLDELRQLSAEELYGDPGDRLRFQRAIAETGAVQGFEVRLRKKGGELLHGLLTATVYRDPDASVVGYQGIIRDVTDRKSFEAELEHRALHDPLTELPNRALFWDRLEHALGRAIRDRTTLAVLFVDLDRFKGVNDSLGHAVGDQLLRNVAERLAASVRRPDTVARIGGDEFTVLLEELEGPEDVTDVANRISRALEEPFFLGGAEISISASVGIALSKPDQVGEHGLHERADSLLRRADRAMYRAKAMPGTQYCLYAPGVDIDQPDRLHRETELRKAIDGEQFVFHYQPIVHLATGKIAAVEALIRWRHPQRGLLAPAEFLGLAEEAGLIVPLGEWILEAACRRVADWNRGVRRDRPLFLHMNASPRQFESPDFVDLVCSTLDGTGLPAKLLEIEVTEHLALQVPERVKALRAEGVGIAVDDFGTGYSSLGYVKHLNADVLKIDGEFVRGIADDRRDEAIVRMILSLAAALDLNVVAEGIETALQLDRLRELGCGWGQGFHLARPLPAEELEPLLLADPDMLG